MTGGAPTRGDSTLARATAAVVVSAACFGSITVLTAVASRGGSTLPNTMAWRYGLAALLLALVSGRAVAALPAGRATRLVVIGGGGQALVSFLALVPLTHYRLPAATLGFLFYSYPAWIALVAAVRGTERIDATRGAALLLSLAGIGFLVGNPVQSGLSPTGVAIALLAALVYALYVPVLGALRGELPPAVASAYVTAGAAAIYAVAAAAVGLLTVRLTPGAWGAVGALAGLCTVAAFILFLHGLAALGPVRTAIVSTSEPFFTALLAAAVLAQPLTPRLAVGGGLIAAAVVLLQRPRTA